MEINFPKINLILSSIFIIPNIILVCFYFIHKDKIKLSIVLKYLVKQAREDKRKKQLLKAISYVFKVPKNEIEKSLENLSEYEVAAREFMISPKLLSMAILVIISSLLNINAELNMIQIPTYISFCGITINFDVAQKISIQILFLGISAFFSIFLVVYAKLTFKKMWSNLTEKFIKSKEN